MKELKSSPYYYRKDLLKLNKMDLEKIKLQTVIFQVSYDTEIREKPSREFFWIVHVVNLCYNLALPYFEAWC